jgi:hypothetical protein
MPSYIRTHTHTDPINMSLLLKIVRHFGAPELLELFPQGFDFDIRLVSRELLVAVRIGRVHLKNQRVSLGKKDVRNVEFEDVLELEKWVQYWDRFTVLPITHVDFTMRRLGPLFHGGGPEVEALKLARLHSACDLFFARYGHKIRNFYLTASGSTIEMMDSRMTTLDCLHVMIPMDDNQRTLDALQRLSQFKALTQLTFIGQCTTPESGSMESIWAYMPDDVEIVYIRGEMMLGVDLAEAQMRSKTFADDFVSGVEKGRFTKLRDLTVTSWTRRLCDADMSRVLQTIERMPSMASLKINAPAHTPVRNALRALRQARPNIQVQIAFH